MPARLNPRQKEQTCAAIQSTLLIKRLQADAFGEIELTEGQRKSISILLDRTVPKLAQIQHIGDPERPVMVMAWAAPPK
jgi:hypothetical protein